MPEENLQATVDPTADVAVNEVASGNCAGELVELPSPDGVTFNTYECQVCHQVLHVGLEDLAEHGLPPAHAPLAV